MQVGQTRTPSLPVLMTVVLIPRQGSLAEFLLSPRALVSSASSSKVSILARVSIIR